jgi:hypothetical protein
LALEERRQDAAVSNANTAAKDDFRCEDNETKALRPLRNNFLGRKLRVAWTAGLVGAAASRETQPPQKKKGTAMRRVIRAFQVEYKNSRRRNSRLVDDPLRLETVASVFGGSGRTGVAKAQPLEQSAKSLRQ